MSTTSNVSGGALSSLASQLFQRVDADSDGRLTTNEFQTFLEGLLNKVGGAQDPRPLPPRQTPAADEDTTPVVYQPMLGFDYRKLNTLTHETPKYVFARATQDLTIPWDRESRSQALSKIAEYAKSHGYPETKVIGDDKLNFGDGYGDIDVLTGDGQWWWGPPA